MKISSKELEAKKVKVVVDKNPVATSFENGLNQDTFHEH
jgi:hypothetical protein